MAAVTVNPASPVSTVSACVIAVTGADQNDPATGDPKTYRLEILEGAELKGKSYLFGVNEDGDHDFMNYVFPDAGTYDVNLVDEADAQAATVQVTVS